MHNFPMTFDNLIIETGEVGQLTDTYVQYELPGSITMGNTADGTYEVIQGTYEIGGDWSGDTFVITHRFFRPN
jgi:hypothetical protein